MTIDGQGRKWWAAVFAVPAVAGAVVPAEVLRVQPGGLVAPDVDATGVEFDDDLEIVAFGAMMEPYQPDEPTSDQGLPGS